MYRPSSTAEQEGYRQHNEFRQMLKPFKYQNCPVANCAWNWRTARAETGNFWTSTRAATAARKRREPYVGAR